MIESVVLPPDLNTAIASESRDFVVKASRAYPLKKAMVFIVFAVFWLVSTSSFFEFTAPAVGGGEVASPNNSESFIFDMVFAGIFSLVGLLILGIGIYMIFKDGGYFVGTPTRLLNYRKGKITATGWGQCTGNIEVSGDDQKGSLTLELNTKHFVWSRRRGRYVPDMLYLCGIANVLEIEKICRQRIKENVVVVS